MVNIAIYLGIFVFEVAMLYYFALKQDKVMIRATLALNMIIIGIFGYNMTSNFGIRLSSGSVYFAVTFVAQYLIYRQWGYMESLKTIGYVFLTSGIAFCITQPMIFLEGPFQIPVISEDIVDLLKLQSTLLIGVFFGFAFSHAVLVYCFERFKYCNLFIHFMIGSILGQIVASSIFYFISYQQITSLAIVMGYIFNSILFKVVLSFLAVPVLVLMEKQNILRKIDA